MLHAMRRAKLRYAERVTTFSARSWRYEKTKDLR